MKVCVGMSQVKFSVSIDSRFHQDDNKIRVIAQHTGKIFIHGSLHNNPTPTKWDPRLKALTENSAGLSGVIFSYDNNAN